MAEQIRLVSDLKVLQVFAEGGCHKCGFFGSTFVRIGSHSDAIEAGPSGVLEKARQVANGFRCYGVVLSFGLAFHLAGMRVFRLGRIGGRLPPCEFAGVAAQTQNAMR